MIGRIFSISFLIFSILLMVIARTYFGKKNDQSSTENEINILLLGGALISLVHYMYPYREKNKTDPTNDFLNN